MTTVARRVNHSSVMSLLIRMVGDYKFGGTANTSGRNFRCIIDEDTTISCAKGYDVKIPAGSELVVYRDPRKIVSASLRIATFHYPNNEYQTVIFGGSVGRTQNLRDRISNFGSRRAPRLHLGGDNR